MLIIKIIALALGLLKTKLQNLFYVYLKIIRKNFYKYNLNYLYKFIKKSYLYNLEMQNIYK